MVNTAALVPPAVLHTARLRLVPLGPEHLNGMMAGLQDQESQRLTGTHGTFTREQVARFVAGVAEAPDRSDWAILRASDDQYLGEVVLNQLDTDNRSMNFRIALNSPAQRGRGYGTEATRAVVAYGFEQVGLHRISLGVYAFNPRAQRVYEKCGFLHEGTERDALYWQGEWVAQRRMAILVTDSHLQDGAIHEAAQ
ncbi:GNAT family N-acetyltransferase [Deinococcus arcticus]|uniref:GNAT family N-acetyltransferase n=1 Tax=Deinococcus arcticus TaxID=2136176 RepID=A0A2T3W6Z1_9DEIO|nr:GNAT family protein [Deinococcus arcticus]PTA67647.1 GNAT family N-acetyltransferase [Deinococcus arcticus]